MAIPGFNHCKGINKHCMKHHLFPLPLWIFFTSGYWLPATTRHFTWTSAHCSVLSGKTFPILLFSSQLILNICRKGKKPRCAGSPLLKDILFLFFFSKFNLGQDISYAFSIYTSKVCRERRLGGSVIEHLPLAPVIIPGSWDPVLHLATFRDPAFPPAYVSHNKQIL